MVTFRSRHALGPGSNPRKGTFSYFFLLSSLIIHRADILARRAQRHLREQVQKSFPQMKGDVEMHNVKNHWNKE